MRLIGYRIDITDNKVLATDSLGNSICSGDMTEILTFLLTDYSQEKDPRVLKWFWDLDKSLALILRFLGEELAERLYREHKCRIAIPVEGGGSEVYDLWYMSEKKVNIQNVNRKESCDIYHLAQYYPGTAEPEDLLEVVARADLLRKAVREVGIDPNNWSSPIAMYKEHLLHSNIPKREDIESLVPDKDIPVEETLPWYALMCAGRSWIEAFQVGHWDKVWDYDLSSAYPKIAAELIDWRYLDKVRSKEYVDGAIYGYCNGIVTINDNVQVSPITIRPQGEETAQSRTGTWPEYLTKEQIDFIHRWKIGNYIIKDGWWLVLSKEFYKLAENKKKPLKVILDRIGQHRGDPNRLVDMIAKGIGVGTIGFFGQEYEKKLGDFNNPPWHAEVMTRTSLKVADFIYRHELQNNVINIAIDGGSMDREVELTPEDIAEGWKLSSVSEEVVVSSGQVWMNSKKPMGLYLEDVKRLIEEDPEKSYYEEKSYHTVTLGEAVEWEKMELLGTEIQVSKTLDLNIEQKRHFFEYPHNGRELLAGHFKSRPYKIEEEL